MDIIEYLKSIAAGLKEISHTDEKPKFFQSIDDYLENKGTCNTKDWFMVFGGEQGVIDDNGARNYHDSNQVAFFVLREAGRKDFPAQRQYLNEAKNSIRPKIYSKMNKDYLEKSGAMKFFVPDSFYFELEDYDFSPMVGIRIEFDYRVNVTSNLVFNPDDWN